MITAPTSAPPILDAVQIAAAARALGASGGGAGAARLLALLYDPDVAVDAVLKCLRAEPALAARVLKVANSPYYGQPGTVGTVDRALQLLGLQAIRGIAAAGCLDRITPPRTGVAFDPERFRRHSLAVASAAEQLSRLSGAGVDAEAFMAGLLHDIGLVLLARLRPLDMQHFTPDENLSGALALQQERCCFGATHLDCNDALIASWGLPGWLGLALAGQGGQAQADGSGAPAPAAQPAHPAGAAPATERLALLPTLLALAGGLAHSAGFGLWPSYPADAAACLAAHPLGLSAAQFDGVALALPDVVARLAA